MPNLQDSKLQEARIKSRAITNDVHEGYHSPSGNLIPANRFIKNAVELNKDQIREKIKEKLSS